MSTLGASDSWISRSNNTVVLDVLGEWAKRNCLDLQAIPESRRNQVTPVDFTRAIATIDDCEFVC